MIKILTKEEALQMELLSKIEINSKKEDEEKLVFTELGRDMFKDNPVILNKYFRNEYGAACYFANLLAFKNVKDTMSLRELKKVLKADFGRDVSLKGYKYNPEHYRFSCCALQLEYEEDLFKCKTTEEEQDEIDAERKSRIEPLDFDAVETLTEVLWKAIRQRYIMILNLESVPGLINNALDCYSKGVSCGPANAAMNAKIAEIRRLLEDNEVIAWLKTGASDMSNLLINDKQMVEEYTISGYKTEIIDNKVVNIPMHEPEAKKVIRDIQNDLSQDYIETYQKVLRQLTDIRADNFEEFRDVIHNEYDLWEDQIIANDLPDIENYIENIDYDEDESDEY